MVGEIVHLFAVGCGCKFGFNRQREPLPFLLVVLKKNPCLGLPDFKREVNLQQKHIVTAIFTWSLQCMRIFFDIFSAVIISRFFDAKIYNNARTLHKYLYCLIQVE